MMLRTVVLLALTLGCVGDRTAASAQSLRFPSGLALSPEGDLVVADRQAHQVFRIDLETGAMSVLAGTGRAGFAGDGGPATEALLDAPEWIEYDAEGDLYLADRNNSRIRVISRDGTIRTVAGTGEYASAGDGGPAADASITYPFGLHFGAGGDLFIFDTEAHSVRRVDGGPGTEATFYRPHNGVFAPDGALIFGDSFNQRIRRWDPSTGVVETLYGRGVMGSPQVGVSARDAAFTYFGGMVIDAEGDLVFTSLDHRIYEIDGETGVVRHLAGTGEAGFSGDGGPATDAAMEIPYGIVLTPGGDIVFSDAANGRIRFIDAETGAIRTLAG